MTERTDRTRPDEDRPGFNWEDFSSEQREYIERQEAEIAGLRRDLAYWRTEYERGRRSFRRAGL